MQHIQRHSTTSRRLVWHRLASDAAALFPTFSVAAFGTQANPPLGRPALVGNAPLRGMKDQFPDVTHGYRHIEGMMQFVCSMNGYEEVRTPILESKDVFGETLGTTSDVVSKQMYSFDDQGTMVVLRPECTASVMRAISKRGPMQPPEPSKASPAATKPAAAEPKPNEDGASVEQLADELARGVGGSASEGVAPVDGYYMDRLFYCGPMFRRERPQAGRQRQFEQFGVECVGTDSVADDAQVIMMASDAIYRLQLRDLVELRVNSIGTLEDRTKYAALLKAYLQPYFSTLSEESQRALERDAPFRVLDSKHETDIVVVRGITKARALGIPIPATFTKPTGDEGTSTPALPAPTGAPTIRDCLSPLSLSRHLALLAALRGIGVAYVEDPLLFRGLDYYAHTTFEFVVKSKQVLAQSAVLAGGRYDTLGSRFSKQPNAGIGWAAGVCLRNATSELHSDCFCPVCSFVAVSPPESRPFSLPSSPLSPYPSRQVDRIYLLMKEHGLLARPPAARYAVIGMSARPADALAHSEFLRSAVDSGTVKQDRINPELPGRSEGFAFGVGKGTSSAVSKENPGDANLSPADSPLGGSNEFSQDDLLVRLRKATAEFPVGEPPSGSGAGSGAGASTGGGAPGSASSSKEKDAALVDASCLAFASALRTVSVPCLFAPSLSYRAQFASASALGVRYAIVIGGNEVSAGTVTVKDLATRDQLVVRRDIALTCLRQDYKDSVHMEYEDGQAAALHEVYVAFDGTQ